MQRGYHAREPDEAFESKRRLEAPPQVSLHRSLAPVSSLVLQGPARSKVYILNASLCWRVAAAERKKERKDNLTIGQGTNVKSA